MCTGCVTDGVLYYYTRSKNLVQVLTTEDEILDVLSQCHSNMVGGGHTGILTTREKVGSRYFWKNWCKHVDEYVSNLLRFVLFCLFQVHTAYFLFIIMVLINN